MICNKSVKIKFYSGENVPLELPSHELYKKSI